jgi:hypothetical protein
MPINSGDVMTTVTTKIGALEISEFEDLVRPVMKWLADNKNPHCKIIIESDRAELVSGDIGFVTQDYIHD